MTSTQGGHIAPFLAPPNDEEAQRLPVTDGDAGDEARRRMRHPFETTPADPETGPDQQ